MKRPSSTDRDEPRLLPCLIVAGASLLLAACTDMRPTTSSSGLTRADSAQSGLLRGASGPLVSVVGPLDADPVSLVSAVPGVFYGFAQPTPITLTFSGPVRSVTVVGNGAMFCLGSLGTLTGYDAQGNAIGSVNLELIDPVDCSPEDNPDNVTFGSQGTLVTTDVMTTAVIMGPTPLEFPVFDLVGRVSQTYSIELGTGAPPAAGLAVNCASPVTRGENVTCTATVTPTQPYAVTRRTATATNYSYVSEQREEKADGSPYEWSGTAVTSTEIAITVTVTENGQETALPPGTARFTVNPRSGPEWTGLRIQTTPPPVQFATAPDLPANPFTTPGSLNFPPGALGRYTHDIGYDWRTVASGPNTNLMYMRSPATLKPGKIIVHALLDTGSAFYRAQRGGGPQIGTPNCRRSDIDNLRNRVIAHELLHFSEDQKFFQNNDVQARLEATYGMFDVSTIGQPGWAKAQEAARDAATQQSYGASWDQIVDRDVDKNSPVQVPSCRVQP